MNDKDQWTYKNEWAEEEDRDPRQELETFVLLGNYTFIKKEDIFKKHRLSGKSEEDKIREFVQTNRPYEVLKQCFGEGRLYDMAKQRKLISLDDRYSVPQIIEKLLDDLGFKTQVKPVGLTQTREELEPMLEAARGNTDLEEIQIDGLLTEMHRKIEDIMIKLFLFYSGVRTEKLLELDDPEIYVELDKLDTLCNDYRDKNKQLGHYVSYLYDLMNMFEYDEVPLTAYQIGELGLFCVFRNLTLKNPDKGFWKLNESNADKSIQMFNGAQNEWTKLWNTVVNAWNSKRPFPKYKMFQRMVVFFQDFLKVLVKDEIYPRVIVMQYHKIDMYGSHTIHAIDDAGKPANFVYKGNFDPFTEYYYQSHTNPIDIYPILAPKNGLENWSIPPKEKEGEK